MYVSRTLFLIFSLIPLAEKINNFGRIPAFSFNEVSLFIYIDLEMKSIQIDDIL